ncbi:hypothetical protein J3R30DRAFT_3462416 [Lentinula aciculospora]|uniref:Uncharacterized protein n=1 Tax=Lentinula aciculospora TaxID=153920 RepID=A0A9W9AEG2_9AGAR|nr:hypothetical protein J3R30DRAFT_3462416 [Lentinula aciculospora]
MLLNLRRSRGNAYGLKNTVEKQRWNSLVARRCKATIAVKFDPVQVDQSIKASPHSKFEGQREASRRQKLKPEDVYSSSGRPNKPYIDGRRNQSHITTGHNTLLSSIERFIASQPSSSQLDSFIHRRLSSSRYLQQYPHTASRAALLEQLVQLLISKRCYVQAAGVYNRMRDLEGYVPASGKSGGEGWTTEAMMLGMALAVYEKSPTASAIEIDQTISTLAMIFRHTSSDRLLLDLVNLLSELDVGNALLERIIWVYVRCREETSSSNFDRYIPPLSIVSVLAGILTRQGKVREALEFVERCDDFRATESRYDRIVARSHPYNTILASLSSFSGRENTEIVDLVLSIMASRDIPSDKSLINILIRDQADRANAPHHSFDSSGSSGSTQTFHPPSIVDDAEEIGEIWDSISGHSQRTQPDRKEQRKQRKKERTEAFKKAFTLYKTLCEAHNAQETLAVSTPSKGAQSEGTEATSHMPSFRPDFFTYRTLWDLLVRRPGWRFSFLPQGVPEAQKANVKTRDVIEDEYGFDLTMGSDELGEGDPELSSKSSEFDDNTEFSVSPVLHPRTLFHDMFRYHFSHLTTQVSTTFNSPDHDTLDVKTTAQAQYLLNTVLLTFLNRSRSSGGADYAAAMVVLRCFCSQSEGFDVISSSSLWSTQPKPWGEKKKSESSFLQVSETKTTAVQLKSQNLSRLPHIPVSLRTYRIVLTHLFQSVYSDIRLALREGTGRGSFWARWVLGIGAGDLRQFRQLLSSPKKEEHAVFDKKDGKRNVELKKPTEKIVERILKISSTSILNGTRSHLSPPQPSNASSASAPHNRIFSKSHLAFHRDFYYFGEHRPIISSSIPTSHSTPSALYVPTYPQIYRTAPLPSLMYYYPDEPSNNPGRHGPEGAKNRHSTQNRLKTRSLDPFPLEIMIKRAWVASNYANYTEYPYHANYSEEKGGKEAQDQDGKLDEDDEVRRLNGLLKMFDREVERTLREMLPV